MENLPPHPGEDVNNGHKILIVSWAECGVALIFVTLRIFTRLRLVRAFGWDDAMIIVAILLSLVTSVLNTIMVSYGVGRHFVFLDQHQQMISTKYIYMSQPSSTFSSCFGKIAVALLLKRITAPHRGREFFLWSMIISLLLVNIVINVFTLFMCKPLALLWDRNIQGSCLPTSILRNLGYLQGAWSSFCDMTLALFPVLVFHDLQMRLRVKIGLILAMSLGIFAAIAAVLKTVQLTKVQASRDQTYDGNELIYYYSTENNLVIIAACIPTLRPLITSTSKLYSAYTGRNMTVEPKSSRKLAYPQRRSYRRHSDLSRHSELAVLESHAKSSSASCTIVPVGDAEDYE